jgi:hypothetical protein
LSRITIILVGYILYARIYENHLRYLTAIFSHVSEICPKKTLLGGVPNRVVGGWNEGKEETSFLFVLSFKQIICHEVKKGLNFKTGNSTDAANTRKPFNSKML